MENIQVTMRSCYLGVKGNRELIVDRIKQAPVVTDDWTEEQVEERRLQRISEGERLHAANMQLDEWNQLLEIMEGRMESDKEWLRGVGMWSGGEDDDIIIEEIPMEEEGKEEENKK
jgi:hypothetical protein